MVLRLGVVAQQEADVLIDLADPYRLLRLRRGLGEGLVLRGFLLEEVAEAGVGGLLGFFSGSPEQGYPLCWLFSSGGFRQGQLDGRLLLVQAGLAGAAENGVLALQGNLNDLISEFELLGLSALLFHGFVELSEEILNALRISHVQLLSRNDYIGNSL